MKKNKKERILTALEQMITSKRYHEIKVEELAKTAGVGKGTIYQYFDSKEDLFFELALTGFEPIKKDLEILIEKKLPFLDTLKEATVLLEDFFIRRHNIMKVFREQQERILSLDEAKRKRLTEHKKNIDGLLQTIFEQGKKENRILSHIPTSTLPMLLIDLLIGRRHWPKDVELLSLDQLLNIFLKGILQHE